jgi:hypothetical protein
MYLSSWYGMGENMVYHYTDGFLTVPKTNAVKAWMNFDEVK